MPKCSSGTRAVHTLRSFFGHALLISELQFLSKHQILQPALSKRTESLDYTELMYDSISKNWFQLVYGKWFIYNIEFLGSTGQALSFLRFILFSNQFFFVTSVSYKTLKVLNQKLIDRTDQISDKQLRELFSTYYDRSIIADKESSVWERHRISR